MVTGGPEPSREEAWRATVALGPFVRRWNLPLNPEDAEEIIYAVLRHARSAHTDDEIVAAVEAQIDLHEEQARRLHEAMRADAKQRGLPSPP